ncbi:uncharacterized protein LOC122922138 isoform X1 [Bufo gargarizans]|uniref:uncharacterized protein LOC122922138 isoform X1 n=1 Tax=Bufo gargarizans TaxID=30331 RepID=UPI001CF3DFA1|nr:uncharacterized protein LOC122922138 isoform X1 [Bufo gargarizans]
MASCAVESSMELSAELIGRDGSSRPFRVTCEGTLRGVLGGLERLQGEVSAELSRLVEREKAAGGARGPDSLMPPLSLLTIWKHFHFLFYGIYLSCHFFCHFCPSFNNHMNKGF